jgi:AraC-like DNA-binding protein
MEEIPKIAFSKKSRTEIDFEIFTINSLFSRYDRLDLALDKPHRIDFYHIIYISRGSGRHFIDFNPYRYNQGSIIFISKGQVHAFDVRAQADGFVILFTDEFLSKNLIHSDILSFYRLYNHHLQDPIIQPEEAIADVFKIIIKEMYWEYLLSNNFAKEEILRLLLKLLLLRAERIKRTLVPKEKNAQWFTTFNVFKNYLEKQFAQTRNASDYAGMMNISYKHLNEVCKSITGNTAKAFIDQFIILESKRRLAVSDIAVKELTYDLGFDEPTNFVKFFKKHTHQSPSQFKKKLTE